MSKKTALLQSSKVKGFGEQHERFRQEQLSEAIALNSVTEESDA